MPMLLIKGAYAIVGTSPDGDTVHFRADTPAEWDFVCGPHRVKRNSEGRAKLRLEGIDTLETHFTSHGPEVSQPPPIPAQARKALLDWVGFTDVQWGADGTVASTVPASVPGFVLTRGADPDNRCIAFAGLGTHPAASGTHVNVDAALLRTTLNYQQISSGLAYPMYYQTLFHDLRDELTAAVQQAKAAPAKGVWAVDQTLTGASVTGMSSITDTGPTAGGAVIYPKLFRRLVEYLNLGDANVAGFPAFLDQKADKFMVLSTGQFTTGLDAVVEVSGTTVKMTRPPEDLVFQEA
ncbi:nuclease [Streptomyces sp. NPDC002138]|uniref:nuclease n=1 Tax=Streptomyces sp. NPDC002138 TaxID=3154410 RepID=UPI00332F388C